MMDKSTESKIRETRAADLTVSVNLDVKKENPGSKLKKKNRLKMKKMLRHQRFKEEKENPGSKLKKKNRLKMKKML